MYVRYIQDMIAKIKNHIRDVLALKTSPHEIALGFAVGAFLAILPTPGLSILLGLLILVIYKKMSKIALFSAMIIFNPFIVAPLHILSFKIGDFLLGSYPIETIDITFLDHFWIFTKRFLLGSFLVALTISLISYILLSLILGKKRVSLNEKQS